MTARYGDALRRVAESLREGRKADLDDRRRSFDEDVWEWNDKRWYWPGGESLRYFEELSPSEAAVIARFCDRRGFSLEGVGTSRVVLRTPESVRPDSGRTDSVVVKLPRYGIPTDLPEGVYAPGFDGGEGRDQNRVEAALWRRATADFLLPVRSVHEEFLWLTMPAAAPLADLDDAATDSVLDDFRTRVATLDGELHLDEVTPENVGRWRGDWYLLDYGRPPLETTLPTRPLLRRGVTTKKEAREPRKVRSIETARAAESQTICARSRR